MTAMRTGSAQSRWRLGVALVWLAARACGGNTVTNIDDAFLDRQIAQHRQGG